MFDDPYQENEAFLQTSAESVLSSEVRFFERKSLESLEIAEDGMVMLLQLVVHFPEPRVGKD